MLSNGRCIGSAGRLSVADAEAAGPQIVQLESSVTSTEILQIHYRGAELKLPAGVDIEAVAALLRSIQSL